MITESPTYIGWMQKVSAWGFSPSPMPDADRLWNVSNWTWENIEHFMTNVDDDNKVAFHDDDAEVKW